MRLDFVSPVDGDGLRAARANLAKQLDNCTVSAVTINSIEPEVFGALALAIAADDRNRLHNQFGTRTQPLHFAARFGTPTSIQMLLDQGLYVNHADEFGNTPLMASIGGLQLAVENTELLLNAGASVNVVAMSGMSALTMAVDENDINVAQLLLKRGASLRPEGPSDNSIFELAAKLGNPEMIELLANAEREVSE
jgi:ankyrin repeat protein